MGKLKEILSDQKNSIKDILCRYTWTILISIIICIILFLLKLTDYNSKNDDIIEKILSYLYFLICGEFLIESALKTRMSGVFYKLAHIVNAVLSFIFNILVINQDKIFGEFYSDYFNRFISSVVLAEIAFAMYYVIKNTGLEFHKYVTKLVFGLIKVGMVLLVINTGFMAVLSIFDSLIFEIKVWDIIEYIEILLTGFLYVPYFLICITDKNEEKSRFVRGFVLYVLMPIIVMAVAIVYLYIFKIIFTLKMPSNEVFSICAWLFFYGVCIWTMAYSFVMDDKPGIYGKIIKYMKYIYAPFILLEIYCIAVRIIQYGVTTERYFAVVFIVCQIIYVVWKKHAYDKLLLMLTAIFIAAVVAPFINYDYASYQSQKARFKDGLNTIENKELEQISKEELGKFIGPYKYLKMNVRGRKYLENNYNNDEFKVYFEIYDENYSDNYYRNWEYVNYRYDINNDVMDIAGYSKLYHVSAAYYDAELEYDELTDILIKITENTSERVDLKEAVMKIIKESKADSYDQITADEPYEIIIDEEKKLLIYSMSFKYFDELDVIKGLSFSGYILIK